LRVRPTHSEVLAGIKNQGSLNGFAKSIGVPRRTVRDWKVSALKRMNMCRVDQEGNYPVRSYIITAAQIDTDVNKKFLENLETFAKHKNAEIIIPGITYNVKGMGHNGTGDADKKFRSEWFDKSIKKYLFNKRIKLNDKIEVLGNLNILPTAVNPLSGYQTFTGSSSAVLPHPKIAFESVATSPTKLAKFLLTCGSVTVPNFMQKNAGIKGEFHHQFGAVIVEVIGNKKFHARHVLADDDGSFYDLTDFYNKGKRTTGHRVESIVWGDIHMEDLDPHVNKASWTNPDNLLDTLKPKHQFFHDLLDFKYRNHHNREDDLFMKRMKGKSVAKEVKNCVNFLNSTSRGWCKSVVVASNHDNAYTRWVRETTHREEPDLDNAIFLLASQLHLYQGTKINPEFSPNLFKWAAEQMHVNPYITFLDSDQSYKVNKIECGMHGDKGINGSRGSIKAFAKIGTKCHIGHSHSAHIFEGAMQAGCSRTINADYTSGPSSWSHTHIVQYKSGKSTLITCIGEDYYRGTVKEAKVW